VLATIERRGRVAILTMNRPEARNAINREITEALDAAYDELTVDDDVWAVVLTGAGDKAFCAGMDLKQAASRGSEPRREETSTRRATRGGFAGITLRDFPKPLIAAVNGFALGGGFEVMLACDLVVAEEQAMLGLPEVTRGIIAGAGGLVRLAQRVPLTVALELSMTGVPITASRAQELGLVNRVVPAGQSVAAAVELAEEVCANAPLAVRISKRVMRASVAGDEADLFALQQELQRELMASEDAKEGPRAFAEKRPPIWQGR
jgi:enoyl-CoA hydratase/carnithine racemase